MFFHRLCPAVIALDIQSSFGITGTLLGVLSSTYFYSYAIMQLPTGLMADSWGPRKTASVFLMLAGVGSVVMGIAPNLMVAITGRVLVGLGVSTIFVCNFKLLSEWFSPRQFIIMGSAFMSMGGIGALSASAPLAWISNVIGWRMTFLSVGAITLLMAALVYSFVRNRPADMGLPPISPGPGKMQKNNGLLSGMKMVVTSGRFWPPAVWAFCVIGISFAIGGLWGGPYLMQVYGLSKTSAGGVLTTFALSMIFGSPLLGWLANRFGRKSMLISCSLMLIAASGIMGFFVDSMTLPALYFLFLGFFFSGGAVGPVIATISKELFPIAISGTAVGAINLFPFVGGAFFQVLVGAVLTTQDRGQGLYTAAGFRNMFLICLAGGVISLAAALLVKETFHRKEGL